MSVEPTPADKLGVVRQSWVTRVVRLTRKELRETLRDRRTIVTLVLMPLLLYPIISVVFQQFMLLSAPADSAMHWTIAASDESEVLELMQRVKLGDSWLRETGEIKSAAENVETTKPSGSVPSATSLLQQALPEPQLDRIQGVYDSDLLALVNGGVADVAIRVHQRDEDDPQRLDFDLIYLPKSSYGRDLAKFIDRRLRAANDALLYRELKILGGDDRPRISWSHQPIRTDDETVQIASLIPLILILMTMTGAVYPAIDLTAGERERGTLEALMAAPVPRLGLLLAKYFAVLFVALMTAVINLTAMTITLQASGLSKLLLGPHGLPISTVFAVLGLLLLFAAFFSAVMLTVTSFARSFKEAQAYLIPLVLLSLAPGFLSLLPGLKLEGVLAITPLANIVLLSRDLLQNRAEPIAAATAVITTVLYALAALAFAAKIFGSDAVLYGSQGSWADLMRRPSEPQPLPTLAQAATAVAIIYPSYFVVNGLLGQMTTGTMQQKLTWSAAGLGFVFFLIPLGLSLWQHLRLTTAWQLRIPSPLAVIGAGLLGLSLWPFAHELVVLAQHLGISTLSSADLAKLIPGVEKFIEQLQQVPFAFVLISMAIMPAICEELFFRGYLQNALQQKLPYWGAILISAALFGVFHLSVGGLAVLERVISSAMLGLVLGWICWRSGSVWPGMLLHMVHNGLLMAMARWKSDIQKFGFDPENESHLPGQLLAVAAVMAIVGAALVFVGKRKASP
ncbi:ABC-2 family transporter protein [Anatilimnocola aggregata]|uniref:ABC-2 family transporter protein n=1 Tax=Anatilimnocola aggregata TaxID=2528021 RepID=A0A517YLT4_9BACT|nr:ABC transporter permease subunit/CPBP intramembrane protease [Anatilimnocola aggregata]QDU31180.1 ABC-2 family transporter protein [Anatilimnocola aggregata]